MQTVELRKISLKFLGWLDKNIVGRSTLMHSCDVFLGRNFLWTRAKTTDVTYGPRNVDTALGILLLE